MKSFSVFYTGMFRYPDKDAAGKRVSKIVDILEQMESCQNITVGGWEQGESNVVKSSKKTSHLSFSILDKKRKYTLHKIFSFLFMGLSLFPWMLSNRKRYSMVILYNPPFLFTLLCVIFGKLAGIKIVLDSTEWYESEHMIGGAFGPASVENWCRMRLAYPLIRNVIAISSFLEHYYRTYGAHVIKVPPLSDIQSFHLSDSKDKEHDIIFLYAGSPGKKDRLDQFIFDLINHKKNNYSLRFYVAGITRKSFLEQYPHCDDTDNRLDDICVFLGRISMQEVARLYEQIDYCVFFRENKRYAIAGFPSKFVEALSHSVPVITNRVGDVVTDFPAAGILFQPSVDNIGMLLDLAFENKTILRSSAEVLFKNKYSTQANMNKLQDFFRQVR